MSFKEIPRSQSRNRFNPVVDSILEMLILEQWLMWMINVFLNVTILTTIRVYVEMAMGRNTNGACTSAPEMVRKSSRGR